MNGIYNEGHVEWKDPEFYLKNRFLPNAKEIDEVGCASHEAAALMLKKYGEAASLICDDLQKNNPDEFKKSNIEPIFLLAKMYGRMGIPMVGFTANAKVFVDKLAKYLNLSDIFLDIATDETMAGGGKEIAIPKLISTLENKGIPASNKQIFVGDSLRGDIGTSLLTEEQNPDIFKQGILVLENKEALIKIKKQISEDPKLEKMVRSIDVYGFVVGSVPLDETSGEPKLFSINRNKFLEKL
jgi:hypothetical protein